MDCCIVRDYVPILSTDIELKAFSDGNYLISNVLDKHYLRVNQSVFNVLQLIDGVRSLGEISELYMVKYNIVVSPNSLFDLIKNKLGIYGVFVGDCFVVKNSARPSYLLFSFVIINESILNKIVKSFYFFFKKKVVISLISILIPFLSIVIVFNYDSVKRFDIQEYFTIYLLSMWISVTFHEFGHATAASYFGSRPTGIGGGFYLFRPVYYADVTDIWRLTKRQRVVVSLSGIYFELIFNSIFLFLGLIIDSPILIAIGVIVVTSTFFNLNPLIRSDGFWIISDMINMPNIYQHAHLKMVYLVKWILRKKTVKWEIADIVLISYGALSYGFMGMFLYYILFVNPQSIIFFPQNLYRLCISIINGGLYSIQGLFELVVPLMFYILLFNLMKSCIIKFIIKIKYKYNLIKKSS